MGNVLSTRSNSERGGVWADKVAVITGGGQGMGAKMGETLAKRGVKGLALADINAEKLEETAAYISRQLTDTLLMCQIGTKCLRLQRMS